MRIKRFLFDLDGTLVDSRHDLATAGNAARMAVGFEPLSVAEVVAFVGDGIQKLIDRLCPNIDDDAMLKAREAFISSYQQVCNDQTKPYPGIVDAIKFLSAQGAALAVVTNKPRQFANPILEAVGLAEYFTIVIGGDQARKPSPEPVQLALAGLPSSDIPPWMIGDHDNDILAGSAAGCRTAWCSWGLHESHQQAERTLHAGSEITALIDA